MNNKMLILSGFITFIFIIFVVIYLVRNREDLTAAEVTDNFVTSASSDYVTLFDIDGNLKSVDLQSYIWTPINNGIKQAYLKLYNDLAQNVNTVSLNVSGNFNLLPKGIIVAWTGTAAPSGWLLCNGSNGTPNLSGRFILGVGQGTGLTNRVINTMGGFEDVTLTQEQMPAHSHGYQRPNRPWPPGDFGNRSDNVWRGEEGAATASVGGNKPHPNMPPFYVLAYIMKA